MDVRRIVGLNISKRSDFQAAGRLFSERCPDERSDIRGLRLGCGSRMSLRSCGLPPDLHDGLATSPRPFPAPTQCYISIMTTAKDLEKAVEQLAPRELARFRAWFAAFDAEQFDAAIERDARAGKLDALAEEALAAHRTGRSREL